MIQNPFKSLIFACMLMFSSSTAYAITAAELLSDHEKNIAIAIMVLGEAEAGGLNSLVEKCTECVEQDSSDMQRGGFLFAAYASNLMNDFSPEDQAIYKEPLMMCIQKSAEYHGFDQEQLVLALDGATQVFNEAMDIISEDMYGDEADEEDVYQESKVPPEGDVLDLYEDFSNEYELAEAYAREGFSDPEVNKYPRGQVPMDVFVGVNSRIFSNLGYSYNDTIYENLKDAKKDDLMYLQKNGTLIFLVPALKAALDPAMAQAIVRNGYVDEKTLKELQRVGKIMQ